MKVSKSAATKLIEQKIKDFEDLLQFASKENLWNARHEQVYQEAELLIKELFSDDAVNEFRIDTQVFPQVWDDDNKKLQDYKQHIAKCIAFLKAHKQTVKDFGIRKEDKKLSYPCPNRTSPYLTQVP